MLPTRAISSRPLAASHLRRALHMMPPAWRPYKDSQDRQSLQPRSAENTKSARDDDLAGHGEAAFDPRKTRPESERAAAGAPLEATGANQELSKLMADERPRATKVLKGGRSAAGTAPKKGDPGRVS